MGSLANFFQSAQAQPAQQDLASLLPKPPGVSGGAARMLPLQQLLPQQAGQQFGFLQNNNVQTVFNPAKGQGYAETWPAAETGDPSWPRPANLPLGVNGVEVKQRNFTPSDYAGEVFSHIDPRGIGYANQLVQGMSPQQLDALKGQSADYGMSIKMGMPEDAALRNAGMSAVRGSVFGQWPQQAIDALQLTPEQQALMAQAKNYAITGR